jgi:hypothetical protein
MKKILFAATFALFASTQVFAIAGIGAHYIMNTGSLKASDGKIPITVGQNSIPINVNQEKSGGLQGLGFKLWIDFLPFIDLEGTFNIAAARYKTFLDFPAPINKNIGLSYPVEAPYSMLFDDASPIYGVATGDISITYPFDILPVIRPYIGAGVSYFVSTPVVNTAFVTPIMNAVFESGEVVDLNDPAAVTKEIGDAVVDALKHADYESGMGGHIIAGVRIKPPIIPVAIYANGKYYFGGNTSSKFSQGFVLEVGGGFAL